MIPDTKVFYFDVETTGTDPKVNEIIQLSGMIEVNGKIKERFNFLLQPTDWDNIVPEALEVTGISKKDLKKFPKPKEAYEKLLKLLGKHCDKYDRNDKFYFAGYNIKFDIDFLYNFFLRQDDKYFGSWFNWRAVDPLAILYYMDYMGMIKLENYKLGTACEHFGIEINAHDAESDIMATRKLLDRIDCLLNEKPF